MSTLTKEDIYAMSAKMMETNAPIKQDHLITFVRLLNKDIFRQDDNLRLLRILQVLLIKIKVMFRFLSLCYLLSAFCNNC